MEYIFQNSDIFDLLMDDIGNMRIMSEALGIDATIDDTKLFQAFEVQYGDIWLISDESKYALLDNLLEKCISA